MKKFIIAILVVIMGIPGFSQEVNFPPMIMAGGGSSLEGSTIQVSRWRLSPIYIVTLDDESLNQNLSLDPDNPDDNELVKLYPNPVKDFLYLEFLEDETRDYIIRLTDMLGRNLLILDTRSLQLKQIIELNLSEFAPAPYLLQIEAPDREIRKCFPLQKI